MAMPQGLLVPSHQTSKTRVVGWMRKIAQVNCVCLAVLGDDLAGVEDAVPAVEPAVGAPGQRIGQLVGIVAAEAGHDDLAGVGLAVAVAILEEEDVGRVGHPDAAVADGDSGGDVQAVGEDGEPVGLAVAVGILEDLDPIAARARLAPRDIPGSR